MTYVQQVLLLLDSLATRPVSTRVLTGRVGGLSSTQRTDRAADRATVSCKGALVLKADLKNRDWIFLIPLGSCPPCRKDGRGNDADETKLAEMEMHGVAMAEGGVLS